MMDARPPTAEIAPASDAVPRAAREVLDFWFGPQVGPKAWFDGGKELDEQIRCRFAHLVSDATNLKLSRWEATPQGSLALILICDQFPRNLYRNNKQAFALDAQARAVAARAHARGFDRAIAIGQRGFFYLPFEHDESPTSQVASVALFDLLRRDAQGTPDEAWAEQQYVFALRHRDAIARFGRFAGRNQALGRTSSAAEAAYLREHPQGF